MSDADRQAAEAELGNYLEIYSDCNESLGRIESQKKSRDEISIRDG